MKKATICFWEDASALVGFALLRFQQNHFLVDPLLGPDDLRLDVEGPALHFVVDGEQMVELFLEKNAIGNSLTLILTLIVAKTFNSNRPLSLGGFFQQAFVTEEGSFLTPYLKKKHVYIDLKDCRQREAKTLRSFIFSFKPKKCFQRKRVQVSKTETLFSSAIKT